MQFLRKYWLPIAAALVAASVVAAAQCAPGIIEDMQRRQGLRQRRRADGGGRLRGSPGSADAYWFMHGCNTDEDYARYFLCNAHIAYERGNVDSADMYLRL